MGLLIDLGLVLPQVEAGLGVLNDLTGVLVGLGQIQRTINLLEHHGCVPTPSGVLIIVVCAGAIDVGCHGKGGPGGFIFAHAGFQQLVEVSICFGPLAGPVQLVGHVLTNGLGTVTVGSPLAMAVAVVNVAGGVAFHILGVADLEAENIVIEIIVLTTGTDKNGVESLILGGFAALAGQFLDSIGVLFQQFLDRSIRLFTRTKLAIVIFQNLIGQRSIILLEILIQSILNFARACLDSINITAAHIGGIIGGFGICSAIILKCIVGFAAGRNRFHDVIARILGLFLDLCGVEFSIIAIVCFRVQIIIFADFVNRGADRNILAGELLRMRSGQIAVLVNAILPRGAGVLQCFINDVFQNAVDVRIFTVFRRKITFAVLLRQLLTIKTGDTGFIFVAHIRCRNSKTVVFVNVSMLGTVGKRNIKDGGTAGFCIQTSGAGFNIIDVFDAVIEFMADGGFAIIFGIIQSIVSVFRLEPLFKFLLAVGVDGFQNFAQLQSLVTFGVFLDVERDFKMTGLFVNNNAVIQIVFRRLFGLRFRFRRSRTLGRRLAFGGAAGSDGVSVLSALSSPLMWSSLSLALPGRVSTVSDWVGRSISEKSGSFSPVPSLSVLSLSEGAEDSLLPEDSPSEGLSVPASPSDCSSAAASSLDSPAVEALASESDCPLHHRSAERP